MAGNFFKKFCILIILPVFLSACGFLDTPKKDIVMTIGKKEISSEELHHDIENVIFGMGIPNQDVKPGLKSIIDKVIENNLILEYGKSRGIKVSDEELESYVRGIEQDYPDDEFKEMLIKRYIDKKEWEKQVKKELLIKKIIETALSGSSSVSFNEMKEYYNHHLDEFRHPRMIKLRQILTRTKKEMDNVLKLMKQGHKMSELAKKYSIAPEAKKGGVIGWVAEGELSDKINKFVFKLAKGERSGILKTPYGYHIFEVIDVKKKGLLDFPDAMSEIESKILLMKKNSMYKKWIDNLKTMFPVTMQKEKIYADWGLEGKAK